MRLAILILWLLTPLVARAEPATIALFVAWAGTIGGAITIAQVVLTVGSMIYGSAQQRKAERKAKDDFNAALNERTVTNVTAEGPYRYVYGRAKVGSSIVAIFTSGDKDQYKHMVCVHAAHECNAFLEVFIAGKPLGVLDSAGWVTSGDYYSPITKLYEKSTTANGITPDQTPSGPIVLYKPGLVDAGGEQGGTMMGMVAVPYTMAGNVILFDNPAGEVVTASFWYESGTPRVRVTKHLGASGDGVDIGLYNDTGGKWPASATLNGFCYTVVTLDITQPEFSGGPPSVEVLLEGKKLYDPRTGLTAWNDNPALVIYDYLTGEVCNIDAADLPLADFIAAANVCESDMGGGNRLYTFNGAVTADQAPAPVLEKMAQAMAGGIVSTTWSVWAGKYTAPVLALDQLDIVGSFALTPGSSDSDKFNGVKGQFISPENAYVATDITPYQNATYLAADGEERWTNVDFPYTDTTQRAHNLARIFTEDARNGYTLKATFSLKAWAIKPGQRVTMTSSLFGWNAKVFRVTDKSYSPTSMVDLTLKEDAASIWDLADTVTLDDTPNSDLPNPFSVAPLAYLNAPQSGTDVLLVQSDGSIVSRMFVSWPASNQANTSIEIEWQVVGDTDWQRHTLSGDATQDYLSPAQDGMIYYVRGRVTRPSVGAVSDWRYVAHQVVGKSAPPPDMTNLSISGSILNWSPITGVPDLAGYVFRFHYGNNLDWGSAVPLHQGVIASMPFDLVTRPAGVVTVMGKAIDTSGNVSNQAAGIIMNLGDAEIANVVESIDLQAQGFPGTYTGASIVAGALIAASLDSAYGTDDQSFYGADLASAYEPSSYAQMSYTSREVAVGTALSGSVMTLAFQYQGTDLFIEYRLSGPGSAYGVDSDSAYGLDVDPFYGEPGSWIPWPGQIVAANEIYQFRMTIGAGPVQGKITALSVIIDAPDIVEYLNDVAISAGGTIPPYTSNFTVIKTVTPTLQINGSGAVAMDTDKTVNLSPVLRAYNAAHTAVSGATADIIIKGY